jgi:hypothetical protein
MPYLERQSILECQSMNVRTSFAFAIALASATLVVASSNDDSSFKGMALKDPFHLAIHGNPHTPASTQILYHNGPVMQSPSVYLIYYGNFPATTQPIINNFLTDLNGNVDPYLVNTTYYDNKNGPVLPFYTFAAPINPSAANTWDALGHVYWDNYSQGTQLGSNSIPAILTHALASKAADVNGVYMVITAPDVKISGFCSSFCAYHTDGAVNGAHVRYALIPDPTQKCSGCNGGIAVYGDTATPNLDLGADTMTDDIMHELSETVTDPDLNAWYTQSGAENGDLCNYVYATAANPIQTGSKTVNGVQYTYHKNFTLNGHDYLVQFIWKNTGAGYCAAQ